MSRSQFDWQVGDDDGNWETIAHESKGVRRHRIPRWVWALVLAAIMATASGGYVTVRQRYETASQRMIFQIQSVVELEARAFEQGDEELFLAQQDETPVPWYAGPAPWLWTRLGSASGLGSVSGLGSASGLGRSYLPRMAVLPATVEDVDLRGGVAWVLVIEDDPAVRRVRFYRQTDRGWLHTAPDPEFWQEPVEHHHGGQLVFYYHQRDQPYIDPLVEQVGDAFYRVCAFAGCKADERFEILIYPEYPEGDLSFDLALPSPWLSGIPVEADAEVKVPRTVLDVLERTVIAWAATGEPATPFRWGQPVAAELWLGVSPVTPEMVALGTPLIRRESILRRRYSVPNREGYTFP
jgi:hypothetical protein